MKTVSDLQAIDIFSDMTPTDLAVISRMICLVEYNHHEYVYNQGDPGNFIYLLKQGRVKIYKVSPDGKELTLAIIEPGEIFGEMALVDGGNRDTTAETLENTALYMMRRKDFEVLMHKKPLVGLHIAKLIGLRRQHAENQLENLVFRTVASRLALLLMALAKKHGVQDSRGIILNVKLSQQELANLIGTARETTSATLNEFKRRGIIDIECRRIKILDRWELEKIADAKQKPIAA